MDNSKKPSSSETNGLAVVIVVVFSVVMFKKAIIDGSDLFISMIIAFLYAVGCAVVGTLIWTILGPIVKGTKKKYDVISDTWEFSWGLIGGIAEGIAGPAAGVAAAIDAQNQNAQNRQIADARANMAANILIYLEPEIKKTERKLANIQRRYEEAQALLVEDYDEPDTYFSKLKIGAPIINISETGTITVQANVTGKPFTIYDNRPATIDGSLTAHIFEEDVEIGQATMVFPEQGAVKEVSLKGMALFCGKGGSRYRVTLSPNDLWAIERPK